MRNSRHQVCVPEKDALFAAMVVQLLMLLFRAVSQIRKLTLDRTAREQSRNPFKAHCTRQGTCNCQLCVECDHLTRMKHAIHLVKGCAARPGLLSRGLHIECTHMRAVVLRAPAVRLVGAVCDTAGSIIYC